MISRMIQKNIEELRHEWVFSFFSWRMKAWAEDERMSTSDSRKKKNVDNDTLHVIESYDSDDKIVFFW